MLTEDKVNGEMVNTETDTDNEIAAFLSAYNKGKFIFESFPLVQDNP